MEIKKGVYYKFHKVKKENRIIVISTLLVGILFSMLVFNTPNPNTTDETIFNVQLASEYIAEISKEEHSVFDEVEHENVRLYLKDKLGEFIGSENVTEYNYLRDSFPEPNFRYDVKNLLGVIPGESETGILIVAHYDSRGHLGADGDVGHSYGAADDGYGIAVILEIARLYGDQNLKNSIYLLMTDAEETGLHGAIRAVQEDFVEDIGFVINIEARGNRGPVYMFETSSNNEKVVEFYKKADLPVAYSFANEVYGLMPTLTDFYVFKKAGLAGVNFAVIFGVCDYHTPEDSYSNINASSIEHYGRQIVPLVEEFVSNEKYSDVNYFDADNDTILFTFLPNILITYSQFFGHILNFTTLLLVIGTAYYFVSNKKTSLGRMISSSFYMLFNIIVMYFVAFMLSNIIAFFANVPFEFVYVRTSTGYIPSVVMVLLVIYRVYIIYSDKCDSKEARNSFIIVGSIINTIFAVVFGFYFSGAAFLFLIPAVSGIVVLLLDQYVNNKKTIHIVYSILMIFSIIVFVPIIFSLYIALTVGGLAIICSILIIYLWAYIPIIYRQLHLK